MYFYQELCYKKAALYIRCSTEEQVKYGDTLESQKADLLDFAKRHNMDIVDIYADEGTTARKKLKNRKQFQRMLEDVQNDKIEVIVFKCLDRWTRNIADFYKIQEILEKHNVVWATTTERYETATANGRLQLNIKLSVAQDEADRTSERIKYVLEHKVAMGQIITNRLPCWIKNVNKYPVVDEEMADIVVDAFEHFKTHRSKHGTRAYIYNKYGVMWSETTFRHILANTIAIGEYRGNPNWCKPIMSKELFDEVQKISKENAVKPSKVGREKIFAGMIKCRCCGGAMTAAHPRYKTQDGELKINTYYRCNKAVERWQCEHRNMINERVIEKYLLENIEKQIDEYIVDFEVQQKLIKNSKITKTATSLKEKQSRLNDLYVNGFIDLDKYKQDFENYQKQIDELEVPAPVSSPAKIDNMKKLLSGNWKDIYNGLSKEEKRILWQSVINRIEVDKDNKIFIIF